jgi:hypothetical protein
MSRETPTTVRKGVDLTHSPHRPRMSAILEGYVRSPARGLGVTNGDLT